MLIRDFRVCNRIFSCTFGWCFLSKWGGNMKNVLLLSSSTVFCCLSLLFSSLPLWTTVRLPGKKLKMQQISCLLFGHKSYILFDRQRKISMAPHVKVMSINNLNKVRNSFLFIKIAMKPDNPVRFFHQNCWYDWQFALLKNMPN